jgi:hypothetical protein
MRFGVLKMTGLATAVLLVSPPANAQAPSKPPVMLAWDEPVSQPGGPPPAAAAAQTGKTMPMAQAPTKMPPVPSKATPVAPTKQTPQPQGTTQGTEGEKVQPPPPPPPGA